ncbi:DUF58 domain-containing protein [Nesterenkonia alba]|uniref:DUF58 domain-containing protein n=1 Tax=Nesterenkonia alba TaxID=515814 RepID=UPI0003B35436|nr:DUF58 domain-containing protein [Nesterenkonia alba]
MVLTWRLLWVALVLAAGVVLAPELIGWWAGLVVVLVVVDLLTAASPRRVRIEREPTRPVRLETTTTVASVVHNLGSRTLRGTVRDGWQPSAGAANPLQPVRIRPASAQRIEVQLTPRRRGALRSAHLSVRSLGVLGVAGRQVTHRVEHTQRVMPPFRSRKHLPSKKQRLRELDGASAVQTRGAGTEFDSLRDYVHGDDARSIDWRGTARRQHLVVRTWRPERDRRVILCLDASRTSAARIGDDDDGEPRLETGIEAALLLGSLAASAGDRTDFLAFHRHTVARVSSAEKGDFTHLLGERLTAVEPALVEADFSRLPTELSRITSQRSLVVLLTSLESASVLEGLLPVLPALTSRHTVLLASVQDPHLEQLARARSTVGEVYSAAAAERSLLESAVLKAELATVGVEVVEAGPHQLPAALADAYIHLKALGRL